MKLPSAMPPSSTGSYADLKLPSHYRPGGYEPPSYDTGNHPPVEDLPPASNDETADQGLSPLPSDPLQAPPSPHLGLPAPWGAGGPWEPEPDSTGSYETSEPAFDFTSPAYDPLAPSASPYGPAPTEQPAPPAPATPTEDRPRRPPPANPWREPTGPLTARQAIIDLSARKRPRPRN